MDKELGVMVPNSLKEYPIKDRKVIICKNPKQLKLENFGESYNGLEDAKEVDLVDQEEEPRMVWIAMNVMSNKETLLVQKLKEHRDVFA